MNNRNYAFDLLKFVAAVVIAVLHYDWRIFPHGYLCVEFFFILAGYLIYSRKKKYMEKSMLRIISDKIGAVYFYWLILIALGLLHHIIIRDYVWGIATWSIRISKMLLFFPFILETAITSPDSYWIPYGQIWYILVWVVGSIIAIAIVRIRNEKLMKYMIAVITFGVVSIVYNANGNHMLNCTNEMNIGALPFGMFRGIQDIFLGLMLGMLIEAVGRKLASTTLTGYGKGMAALVMLLCISAVCAIYVMRDVTPEVDYLYIVLVAVIIMMCSFQMDMISKTLYKCGKAIKYLWELSVPIYFFHYPVIRLMNAFGLHETSVNKLVMYLILTFVAGITGQQIERALRKIFGQIVKCLYYWE